MVKVRIETEYQGYYKHLDTSSGYYATSPCELCLCPKVYPERLGTDSMYLVCSKDKKFIGLPSVYRQVAEELPEIIEDDWYKPVTYQSLLETKIKLNKHLFSNNIVEKILNINNNFFGVDSDFAKESQRLGIQCFANYISELENKLKNLTGKEVLEGLNAESQYFLKENAFTFIKILKYQPMLLLEK